MGRPNRSLLRSLGNCLGCPIRMYLARNVLCLGLGFRGLLGGPGNGAAADDARGSDSARRRQLLLTSYPNRSPSSLSPPLQGGWEAELLCVDLLGSAARWNCHARAAFCGRSCARQPLWRIEMKWSYPSTWTLLSSYSLIAKFTSVILFLLWGLCCCKIGWDSVMRMSVDLRDLFLYEAFLYYNPLLLVALMIWLWGASLWVFAQSSVNYAKVFDLAQPRLSHREIWRASLPDA